MACFPLRAILANAFLEWSAARYPQSDFPFRITASAGVLGCPEPFLIALSASVGPLPSGDYIIELRGRYDGIDAAPVLGAVEVIEVPLPFPTVLELTPEFPNWREPITAMIEISADRCEYEVVASSVEIEGQVVSVVLDVGTNTDCQPVPIPVFRPILQEVPLGQLDGGAYELHVEGRFFGLPMEPTSVTFGVQGRPALVPIGGALPLLLPGLILLIGLLVIGR
ncbi:MAG: hypothetical protein AAGJ52_01800 [Pseudomonadota bacterium]